MGFFRALWRTALEILGRGVPAEEGWSEVNIADQPVHRTYKYSDSNGTYESDRAFAVPRDGVSWREADRYARSIGKCTCEGRVGCCEECPHLHML
jgi:hypothetical protein